MFVQLLNQNATNILGKNKAIYGFSSFGYTLVFINSFLSRGNSGVSKEKGGSGEEGAGAGRQQRRETGKLSGCGELSGHGGCRELSGCRGLSGHGGVEGWMGWHRA